MGVVGTGRGRPLGMRIIVGVRSTRLEGTLLGFVVFRGLRVVLTEQTK